MTLTQARVDVSSGLDSSTMRGRAWPNIDVE